MRRATRWAAALLLLAAGCSSKDTGPAGAGPDATTPAPAKPKPGEKPKMN